jgi:transposase
MDTLYAKRLTRSEKDFLLKQLDENTSIAPRARIILLSRQGYSPSEIAVRLNLHLNTVRKWISEFNTSGVRGVLQKPKPGRKPKFDKQMEKRIVGVACRKPERLGLPYLNWSLRKLKVYLEKKRIARVSVEELRRILLSHGVVFRKSRRKLISEDPDYEAKKARIRELLERPNCHVLFVDEKGPMTVKRYGGSLWTRRKRVIIKANQKLRVKKRLQLFEAYCPHMDRIFYRFYTEAKSPQFRDFLIFLSKKLRGEKLYVVLDNTKVHKAKLVQEYVKDGERIELVFLPKGAPELNEIENKYSLLQREVLNNSNFRSAKELERAVRCWLSTYNRKGM